MQYAAVVLDEMLCQQQLLFPLPVKNAQLVTPKIHALHGQTFPSRLCLRFTSISFSHRRNFPENFRTLDIVIFGELNMKKIQLLTPILGEDETGVLWVSSPPEQSSTKLAQHLWNKSTFRSCTDGAANFIMPLVKNENYLKPNLISGDFDSITIVARKFFESQVEIVETPDQDYTDMCKALKIIAERMRNKKLNISKLIVLGGLSGRFDHVLSSLHSLLRFDSCEIAIIDGANLVTILGEGSTNLEFTGGQHLLTGKCGVIPFLQRETIVSSSGLKWNLDKTELAFGKLISTSNEMVSDAVSITCTTPVIFTMELSENALSLRQ